MQVKLKELKLLKFLVKIGDIKGSSFATYKSQGFKTTKLQELFIDLMQAEKTSELIDKITALRKEFHQEN